MKNINKIIILIIIIFLIEVSHLFSIGKIIEKFFPCEQREWNFDATISCSMGYDISIMLGLIFIFIICIIILGFKFYKSKKIKR